MKKTRILVESAVMIALATVLSLIKPVDLPYGGSVTLASMFPIILISYRYGVGRGLAAGLVYGIIQQLLGINTLSYVSTPQSIIAVILLDYIVAFLVCGLGGMFRKTVKNQAAALTLGSIVVCILRYICHVISGATVWAGISIPTAAALGYSFIYNATYMLPETIVLVIVACYVGSVIDLSTPLPTRLQKGKTTVAYSLLGVLSGVLAAAALICDVVAVFSKLQNAETGEFAITGFSSVNWTFVIIVTAAAAVICAALLAVRAKCFKSNGGAHTETNA